MSNNYDESNPGQSKSMNNDAKLSVTKKRATSKRKKNSVGKEQIQSGLDFESHRTQRPEVQTNSPAYDFVEEIEHIQEPKVMYPDTKTNNIVPWRMLTNRYNLLTMLGSGMITSAQQSWRYQEDSRNLHDGYIPLWKGLIPDMYSALLNGEGIDTPVILEFKEDVTEYIDVSDESRIVYQAPIPFIYVSGIKFSNSTVLEDFKLRLTDDLPLLPDGIYGCGFPQLDTEPNIKSPKIIDSKFFPVKHFDKLIGGFSVMLSGISSRTSSGRLFTEIVLLMFEKMKSAESVSTKYKNIFSASSMLTENDQWLYTKTLDWLSNVSPESGFVASEFLLNIRQSANAEKIESIVNWCDNCQAIINGDKEFLDFNDSKNFMQRGVALFLLRFDQERFAKLESSKLNPGPKVYIVAASLVGYFTGMTMIEPKFRMSWQNQYKAVQEFLNVIKSNKNIDKNEFTVTCDEMDNFQATLSLRLSNSIIASWRSELDGALKKLQFSDQHDGITTSPDFLTGELVCKFENNPSYDVRIKLLSSSQYGKVARFYGYCQEKSAKSVKIEANILLQRNGFENLYGKYAWDEAGRLIYAQDQMIKTCDEDELHAHIRHIHDVILKS